MLIVLVLQAVGALLHRGEEEVGELGEAAVASAEERGDAVVDYHGVISVMWSSSASERVDSDIYHSQKVDPLSTDTQ